MKKLMLLLLTALLTGASSCEDDEVRYPHAFWRVKNSTDQTLSIARPPYAVRYWNFPDKLAPGEEGVFFEGQDYGDGQGSYRGKARFELLLRPWGDWAEENILLEVRSTDGTIVAAWKLTDAESAGKNFFKASSWNFSETYDEARHEMGTDWVFEILPEDINH
jgi:hypothetical protein